MKVVKRASNGLVVLLCLFLVLSACSKTSNEAGSSTAVTSTDSSTSQATDAPKETDQEPAVELIWHYPQPQTQADLKEVEAAVSKITKEKINVTIKLDPFDFGSYEQKMNTILAAGEDYDIAWTSNWSFNYVQNVQKGAFLALDDLMASKGAALTESMPKFVWDATRVGGKVYGVPNYQTVTNRAGFTIQKRYLDKVPFDMATLKKFEDITPFLDALKKAEPNEYPYQMPKNGSFDSLVHTVNLQTIDNGIGIYLNDPATKITSLYETPEFKNYLTTVRDWYKKGYIHPDAAILKSFDELVKQGKFPVTYGHVMPPGIETNVKNSNGGNDVAVSYLSEPYVGTSSIITTLNAINKSSKHPEKAMEFINLMNTDKDLFNLVSFGIEGKHYKKVADNTIAIDLKSGYAPNTGWVFGNTFNGFLLEGQDAATFNAVKQENESAAPSPIIGFSLDPQPILSEMANVKAVTDEYIPLLATGSVDSSKKLDEFIQKLKKAGMDKIVTETQRQVDEWKTKK